MTRNHWLGIIVVLLVGYALGVSFPSYGSAAIAKVKGLA